MATLKDLQREIRQLIVDLETKVPEEIAVSMKRETERNFVEQGYGNDDSLQVWPNRYGKRKGKFGDVDHYLPYTKLRRSNTLFRSLSPSSGRNFSQISFSAPYAQAHNEGVATPGNTSHSVNGIYLKAKTPAKRQFAGVGKRTHRNVLKIYRKRFQHFM